MSEQWLVLKGLRVLHPVPVAIRSRLVSPTARWIYLCAWMAVIFLASSDSSSGSHSSAIVAAVIQLLGIEPTPAQLDLAHLLFRKSAHFTEYAILALLWAWALPRHPMRLIGAWTAATLYAASDEFHQGFVANRGPAITDVAIDATGAATALLLLWLLRGRRLTQ